MVFGLRASPIFSGLKRLNIRRRHILGGIGIALNIALRTMAKPALEFVGISPCSLRKVKRKGMTQVMGTEWAHLAFRIINLSIMPVSNLFENGINRAYREPAIGTTAWCGQRREKQRGCRRGIGIALPFMVKVVGKGQPRIGREKDAPFGFSFATNPAKNRFARGAERCRC